jgi:molybdopterin molybdotransferase
MSALQDLGFEEALAVVRRHALALDAEQVPVERVAGRRLAADVRTPVDVPAFTNSAMDGYAVRAGDPPGELRLVGESAAGLPWGGRLAAGQAVRISTGASLPEGADAVVAVEEVAERDDTISVPCDVPAGRHIRHRGEVLREGDVLLPAGAVVAPHEVGVIAASGLAAVACLRPARVALLSSGDELVPLGGTLRPGAVFDSNRYGLRAQAEAAGAQVVAWDTVRDDPAAVREAIDRLLGEDDASGPDLLITVGGVSVGPHDHLKPALAAGGVEEVFWRAKIKPGHPVWFGTRGRQRVLGLPGNPVSAAVCFHLFGRPLLGRDEAWDRRAPLAAPYRRRAGRDEFIRCRETGGGLVPLPNQDSHAISSLAGASVLAWLPAERTEFPAGEELAISRLL